MNQIYRVVFNHATGVWQCVSELAKAKGKTKSVKMSVLAVAIGASLSGQAMAATTETDDQNYLSGKTTTIASGDTVSYTLRNNPLTIDNATVNVAGTLSGRDIVVANTSDASTVNLNDSSANLTATRDLTVGNAGTGTVNVTAGTVTVDTNLIVGNETGSTGTVTLDGTNSKATVVSSSAGQTTVGENGTGTLTVKNGASFTTPELYIANQAGSTGTVTVANSTLNSNSLTEVGYAGNGTLNISDSTVTLGSLSAGSTSTATGTINASNSTVTANAYIGNQGTGTLTADNSTLTGNLAVGVNGTGTATLTGGTTLTGDLTIGSGNGAGTVTATDSTINATTTTVGGNSEGELTATNTAINSTTLLIGNNAKGTMTTTNGSINGTNLTVGYNSTGELTATNTPITTSNLIVSEGTGNGTLTATTGAITASNTLAIAKAGGTGTATLTDVALSTDTLSVATQGTGTLSVTNGSVTASTKTDITDSTSTADTTGSLTLTNTSIDTPSINIAGAGAGNFTATDTTITTNAFGKDSTAGTATVKLDNTTWNVASATGSLFNNFATTDSITATNTNTFNVGSDTTIADNARITGDSKIVKTGTGTLTLNTATKGWTGETHIDQSKLIINGDYTMASGEVLALSLNDETATDYGQLVVNGNANIDDGTLKIYAKNLVDYIQSKSSEDLTWKEIVKATALTGTTNEFSDFVVVDNNGDTIANDAHGLKVDYSEVPSGLIHLQFSSSNLPSSSRFVPATTKLGNQVAIPLAHILDKQLDSDTNLGTVLRLSSSTMTDEQLSQSASELLPLFMGAVDRVMLNNQAQAAAIIDSRNIERESTLWAKLLGSRSTHDRKNSVVGYEIDDKGVIVGADKALGNASLGVAVAYSEFDGKTTDTVNHTLDGKSLQGMVYGDYAVNDKTSLNAQVSMGKANIKGERHINTLPNYIGLSSLIAKSDYDAETVGASIGATHRVGTADSNVTPYVRFNFQRVSADAYDETGAGVYNLSVKPQAQRVIEGLVGVNAKKKLGQSFDVTGNLGVGFQNGDRQNRVNASFVGTPDTDFTTNGHKRTVAVGTAGVGLGYQPSDTTRLSLNYQGQWHDAYDNQGVVLNFAKKF